MSEKGSEVVLIEFVGNAASAVAASDETVAGLDAVTDAAARAGEAQTAAGKEAAAAGKQSAAAAEKTAAATRTSSSKMSASMAGAGASMGKVGKGLTKFVSLPLIGIGAAATKMSLDFSKAMLLVETHTDTTQKMTDRYRKTILSMSASGKFTQGPKEMAEAMYHVASDGYKGSKALETLKESADLAMLGQSGLAETTYAVVSAMKTGIKGTQDLHDTIGTLNGTMGAGDTKMGELTAALSTGVVPAARSAGLELRDVGASIAFLTARGIPAQKAAYGLSMNFQQLVPYTNKAQEAFERLGIGLDELGKKAKSGPMGWLKALEDLKAHLKGMSSEEEGTAIREIFGGGRTSRGVLAQMQNLDDLRRTYERLNDIAGKTNKNLSIARKSPANQWKEEWAQLQAALTEVGDVLVPVLIPAMKEVAGDVVGMAHAFEGLSPGMKHFIVDAGLAAIALGPLVRLVGGLTTGLSKVVALGGKAAGAIGGIGAAEDVTATTVPSRLPAPVRAAEGGGIALAGSPMTSTVAADAEKAAPKAATSFAGGFGKAIPIAFAAAGIGNIITSLVNGDTKDAGYEGGGALIGGIVGAFAGPEGAAIGVGIGSVLGEAFEKLISKGKMLSPLQRALRAESKHVADAFKDQQKAAEALVKTEGKIPQATKRSKDATRDLHAAEAKLASDRKQFGADSQRVRKDELLLAEAKKKNEAATKSLSNLQKLSGNQLELYRHKTTETVAAEKLQIRSLKEIVTHLGKRHDADKENIPLLERLVAKEEKLEKASQRVNKIISESAVRVGPGYAKSLRNMNLAQDQFGKKLEGLKSTLGVLAQGTGTDAQKMERSWKLMTSINNANTESWTKATLAGIREVGGHMNAALRAINASPISFGTSGGGEGKKAKGNQRGGPINLGAPSGDSVPAMLEKGEYVLNRKAVKKVGKGKLDQINFEHAPRFAKGGGIGGEPHESGAGALLPIGQGAVHSVFKGAQSFYSAHKPKAAGLYGGPTPPGVGSYQGFPVDNWIIPILKWAAKHGWGGHLTSGYRTLAEGESLYANRGSNPNPVAAPGTSNHEKASYPGGAIDVSDGGALAAVLKGYKGHPSLVWGPDGGNPDPVHYSATGRRLGGIVEKMRRMASGGSIPQTFAESISAHKSPYNAALALFEAGMVESGDASLKTNPSYGDSSSTGVLQLLAETASGLHVNPMNVRAVADLFLTSGFDSHGGADRLAASGMSPGDIAQAVEGSAYPERYATMAAGARKFIESTGLQFNGQKFKGLNGKGTTKKKMPTSIKAKIEGGKTSAGGGTFAPGKVEVGLSPLTFESMPTTLIGVRKELAQRRGQLILYSRELGKAKKKDEQKALRSNIGLLKQRIQALVKQQSVIIKTENAKAAGKGIEKRGKFEGLEEVVRKADERRNIASQDVERLATLEPEEESPSYRGSQVSAYERLFDADLADRNAYVTTGLRAAASKAKLEALYAKIKGYQQSDPTRFKSAKEKLPAIRTAIQGAKSFISEQASNLESIQGAGGPSGLLSSLPWLTLSGQIFSDQNQYREMLLPKTPTTTGPSQQQEELLATRTERLAQLEKGHLLDQASFSIFKQFLDGIGGAPYIGAFKSGGVIPGSPNQAYSATVHGGETIIPAGGAVGPVLELHLHGDMASAIDAAMPGLVKELDRMQGKNYRQIRYSPSGSRGGRGR